MVEGLLKEKVGFVVGVVCPGAEASDNDPAPALLLKKDLLWFPPNPLCSVILLGVLSPPKTLLVVVSCGLAVPVLVPQLKPVFDPAADVVVFVLAPPKRL